MNLKLESMCEVRLVDGFEGWLMDLKVGYNINAGCSKDYRHQVSQCYSSSNSSMAKLH